LIGGEIMAKIKLELSDWLYNAGIVGIANIFDNSDVKYEKYNSYIEFDESALENFEEKYFKYFIHRYEKFTSWYKIISLKDYIKNFDIKSADEKNLTYINGEIENLKKKLTSNSYKSGYLVITNKELDLIKEEKKLKKIKLSKDQSVGDVADLIIEQFGIMERIIDYLERDEVKKIILAKNVIYDIIQKFWSDVSFLNKNNSNNDMYKEYEKYFIEYVKEYINEDKKKSKYSCFTCGNKISKLSKPEAYDLTWINKMGVDMSRKSSHYWNFNGDTYICPICNLVYSCIPAGFTMAKDKGIFINQNSSASTLIKINKFTLEHNTTLEELEQESYFNIVGNINQSQIEQFDKEIENIQIVKLDSNNQRRPYTFNVLSKDKLQVIYDNKNMLNSLIKIHAKINSKEYLNLYREVIYRLYNGRNQFDLINQLFHLKLQDKFNRLLFIEMIIKINNNFIEGRVKNKMVYNKDINDCKNYGLTLRKAYADKKAENKLSGITYRLLNALKTKNTSRFMDTILNAYMYLNKQIPTTFIEGLKDVDKFQTIGYAFLLGLQGEEKVNGKEENLSE